MDKRYLVMGVDGSSDNGCFDIVVEAASQRQALSIAEKYLKECGRPELVIRMTRKLDGDYENILYSTVEAR